MKTVIACGLLLFSAWVQAKAPISVVVLTNSNPSYNSVYYNNDISDKLKAMPGISRVDIEIVHDPRTIQTRLKKYDAIFAWYGTMSSQYKAATLNYLVQSARNGQGVVLAGYTSSLLSPQSELPLICSSTTRSDGAKSLGNRLQPSHPILAGVKRITDAATYRSSSCKVNAKAKGVANWSDGQPMVALRSDLKAPIVQINMYPASNSTYSKFWDRTTDGARLFANALLFSAGKGGPGFIGPKQPGVRGPQPRYDIEF